MIPALTHEHGKSGWISLGPREKLTRICQENNRYQDNYVKATNGMTGTGNSGADSGHGHPAKGSFIGEWGINAERQENLLIVMDWDGTSITGTINPGPDGVPITNAELNPDDWTLRIEAGTGAMRIVLDGKFQNLTWAALSIVVIYARGDERGNFKISRQY